MKIIVDVPDGDICGKCFARTVNSFTAASWCAAFGNVRLATREGDGAAMKCEACCKSKMIDSRQTVNDWAKYCLNAMHGIRPANDNVKADGNRA